MTIAQVQYVCEIAKRGSMTKAAEQFYISQPALSEQIKSLETELGCVLFRRTARGTELTEAGEQFCRFAEPAVRAWKKLEQNSAELKNIHQSSIRIGFGLRARSNSLFEPVMIFFDGYPDVSFSVITDMNENFPEAVEARRLDIAIGRMYENQIRGISNRIAVFPLISEPQCILMSREDRLSREERLNFRVMDGRAAICGPVGSGDDAEMKSMCEENDVHVSRVLRADDINAVIALVQRKKGYALGPRSFAEYFGVAAVPLEPDMEVALNLFCRKEDQDTPLIRGLRSYLENSLTKKARLKETSEGRENYGL